MRSSFFTLIAAISFMLFVHIPLCAQVKGVAIGPKVGFHLDRGTPMVGAIMEFTLTPNLDIEPGVEYVFEKLNTTRLVIDGNLRYSITLTGLTVRPFVLAGVGLVSDYLSGGATRTDVRLNLGGGAVFNSRSLIQYWAGLKIFLLAKNDSDVLLQGGVLFYL